MHKFWAIVGKDLLIEWRQKDFLTAMLAMMVAMLLVFGLTTSADQMARRGWGPGILWMGFLIAGMIGLGRGYARESFEDTITGLITAPGNRAIVFWAKAGVGLLFMLATEGVMAPVFLAIFNVGVGITAQFGLVLILGAVGLVAVGTFISALAFNLKGHDTLMPLFLVPLEIPLLITAVQATAATWAGRNAALWIHGLVAYDAIFVVLPVMAYHSLWEV